MDNDINNSQDSKSEMRERFKFILSSYRPDGADAHDPDFAEALQMAAEDRELGAWLADERAHDAIFTNALEDIELPDGLKEEILSVLEFDGAQGMSDAIDGEFIGALASVTPPDGLRDQILSAMAVEKTASADKVVPFPIWKWASIAVAALVVISFIVLNVGGLNGGDPSIEMHDVQLGGGNVVSASYEMDVTSNQLSEVNNWLEKENYPVATDIPKGLIGVCPQGGKKLIINDVEVSVVFFEKKQMGKLYLLVLNSENVEDLNKIAELSEVSLRECATCPKYKFTVVTWKKGNHAYMLLTKAGKSDVMKDIF